MDLLSRHARFVWLVTIFCGVVMIADPGVVRAQSASCDSLDNGESIKPVEYYRCTADIQYPKLARQVDTWIARVGSATGSAGPSAAVVLGELSSLRVALDEIQSKVGAEQEAKTARLAMIKFGTQYRTGVTMAKAQYVTALSTEERISTKIANVANKIERDIAVLASQGGQVPDLSARMNEIRANVALANSKSREALDVTVALRSDQGDKNVLAANRAALQSAAVAHESAFAALAAARSGLGEIAAAYKQLLTSPTISLSMKARVKDTAVISATASSTIGVASITLSLDGMLLGKSKAAPYVFDWDTTAVENGKHSIMASVRDVRGQEATTTVMVTVANKPQGAVYKVGPPSGGSDTAKIQAVVDAAIADLQSGKVSSATIRLEPGATYMITSLPDRYQAIFITTKDLAKHTFGPLVFDGQGATLALERTTAAIYMNGCTDCELKNFTVRDQTSPFAEGVLSAVSSTTLTIELTAGEGFMTPVGYKNVVGKNDGLVIFHVEDPSAFPTGYEYPDQHGYIVLASASTVGRSLNVAYDRVEGLYDPTRAPLTKTRVVAVSSPLDETKRAAIQARLASSEVVTQRTRFPEYGPTYFVGQPAFALVNEENTNLKLSRITISDFPGNGIMVSYNRGRLALDSIRVVPRTPGGLLSVSSDAISAANNEQGPVITNSTFINTGDDTGTLVSFPLVPISIAGTAVDVKRSSLAVLGSFIVRPGDRLRLVDRRQDTLGAILDTYTVTSAAPYYMSPSNYGYHLTLDHAIPSSLGRDDVYLVNIDRSNKGLTLSHNAFIGGNRNGFYWDDTMSATDNLVAGFALAAMGHHPFIVVEGGDPDPWGDYGPASLRDNVLIDNGRGFLRVFTTGTTYAPPFGTLTASGNTVFSSETPASQFFALRLDGSAPVPSIASSNTIIKSANDVRKRVGQFIGGSGDASAWVSGFSLQSKSSHELWAAKCAAVKGDSLWLAAIQYAAPGACL